MSEGERVRSKRLLKDYKLMALRKKGEELLAVLPQGEGSGLDADMVDGLHAEEIIAEALERIGLPKKGRPTFGGGGMAAHGNELHVPDFEPLGLSLLLDGSRPMTDALKIPVDPTYIRVGNARIVYMSASYGSQNLAFRNAADTLYQTTYFGTLRATYFQGKDTTSIIRTKDLDDAEVKFQARDNDTDLMVTCGILKSASEPYAGFNRMGDITVLASKVLNFGSNPILYTPMKHICGPVTLAPGVTDAYVQVMPAGTFDQDMHVDKVVVSVDVAPSAGKTVTVTVSDGTNTMTVTIADAATSGSTTTNNFDLDVSAESLTLNYSQTAGGLSRAATIACVHHYITNI